jgi:hypothetical protein
MNYPAFGVSNRRPPNSSSRYDKDNAKENMVFKMFRYMSNDSFSRIWDANYKVVTIGDLFLGVSYGRPIQWSLHWKTAKLVCEGIYEKSGRSKDKMNFRPFQYMGYNNEEYP